MVNSNLPPDHAAREQALDCSASFAVSAPAGSGKTELLIQRTLKLLSQTDSPESILAITFSRKAAAEMRERVVQALVDAQDNQPILGSHQQLTRDLALAALAQNDRHQWALIENSHRLQIHTIDAFNRKIASQLSLDTCVSLPSEISEKPEHLYLNAAEDLLKYLDSDTNAGEHLRSLCGYFDGNVGEVAQLLADMLATRDSWLTLAYDQRLTQANYLEETLYKLVQNRIELLQASLARFASEIEDLLDYALQSAEQYPPKNLTLSPDLEPYFPVAQAECLPQWKALIKFLCTQDLKGFRKTVNVNNGFPSDKESQTPEVAKSKKIAFAGLIDALKEVEDLLPRLRLVHRLPELEPDTQILEKNKSLLALLPLLAAQFSLQVQRAGETDFVDVSIAALQALERDGLPTTLALRLDYRISHILVDEFQDTSNLQVRLLEHLTAGWEPDDGRTLFIVGDGMQSIYSFRKANVSLFVRARKHGIGDLALTPLNLTANFRSDAQIVDWVNQTFSQVFKSEDNLSLGQVGFRDAISTRKASQEPIYTRCFDTDENEAEDIADKIAERCRTSDGSESIALLIRARTHLKQILPALRARGIAWQAQNIDKLNDRMAVLDIHSLTRALCVPADRIAWLAILRAPWAGLSNADLLYLCQTEQATAKTNAERKPASAIWEAINQSDANPHMSAEGQQILVRVRKLVTDKINRFGAESLRVLVEELWNELDGSQGLLDHNEAQDVQDYLDLLENAEIAGTICDWQAFDTMLEEAHAQPTTLVESEHVLSSPPPVQIMTMYKAKGLQFDHVYMIGLNRKSRNNDSPLLLYAQPEDDQEVLGYLASVKPAAGYEDDLYQFLKAEQNRRTEEELARLLYVGCTRAKKTLTLSFQLSTDDKGKPKAPNAGTLAKHLWEAQAESFLETMITSELSTDASIETLSTLRRLAPDRPIPVIECSAKTTDASMATTHNDLPAFTKNLRQRALGDLLHDTLRDIVDNKTSEPTSEKYIDSWKKTLSAQGYDDDQQTSIIHDLKTALENMLNHEVGKWMLSSDHEESFAELSVDYLDTQYGIQQAIIDRTFIDKGVRWVIDYKSSIPNENETIEEFLTRESETYTPQLAKYASLFDDDIPVKTMLYFPSVALHVEVDLSH